MISASACLRTVMSCRVARIPAIRPSASWIIRKSTCAGTSVPFLRRNDGLDRVRRFGAGEPFGEDRAPRIRVLHEFEDGMSDHLVLGVAEDLELGVVDARDPSLGVHFVVPDRRVVEELAEPPIALDQCGLGAFLVGDVAADAEGADDGAVPVAKRAAVRQIGPLDSGVVGGVVFEGDGATAGDHLLVPLANLPGGLGLDELVI